MKSVIKNIVKMLGLMPYAKKISKQNVTKRKLEKYKGINSWLLNYEGLSVAFDIQDDYSKAWFYPRYDNGKIHEPTATKIFIDYVENDSQVFDIGGHLGYFSCVAAAKAQAGMVHVFEVDPMCQRLIKKNLKTNGFDNAIVNNYAVSDSNEIIRIPKLTTPNPATVINSAEQDAFVEVESICIDDYVREHSITPSFIKIDVEGAEYKVLCGMAKVLSQKELTMLVEIHVDNLREHFDTDYKVVLDLLHAHGFTMSNIDHRISDSEFRPVTAATVLTGNTMVFCQKGNL